MTYATTIIRKATDTVVTTVLHTCADPLSDPFYVAVINWHAQDGDCYPGTTVVHHAK